MADQTMVVTDAVKAGVLDVAGDANKILGNAAGTDFFFFANDGRTVLVCVCGTSAKVITFTAVDDKFGRTETLAPAIGSSKTSIIGPFMPELWNDSSGLIKFKPASGGQATDIYLAVRVANPT